jgi:DNA repair exonuclease SbcCD ATPase subunit
MTITKLEASNVLRLSAVNITPEGNLVVIGGENAQGKSSVLNSIAMALAGEKFPKPLRDGAQKGSVEIDLGEITVKRTFTHGGGGTLTVKGKDGVPFTSPQTMLDKIIGSISFDPLAFTREKPARQLEILRQLAGVDTSALDAEFKAAFDDRTNVNRDLKAQEARLSGLVKTDAPPEEVSIADLSTQLQAAIDANAKNAEARAEIARLTDEGKAMAAHIGRLDGEIKGRKTEIEELTKVVAGGSERLNALRESITKAQAETAALQDIDTAAISAQIVALQEKLSQAHKTNQSNDAKRAEIVALNSKEKSEGQQIKRLDSEVANSIRQLEKTESDRESHAAQLGDFRDEFNAKVETVRQLRDVETAPIKQAMADADATNRRVRANKQYAEEESKRAALAKQSRALDTKLEVLQADKRRLIRDAKYPLEGLSLTDDGIVFEGIPFEQASSAEQLRVSMAIALAMNPKLRVCLIRDGSLLDSRALAAVAKMAEDAQAQIWLERVGEGKECQVIIEDGHVKETLL